MIFFAYKTLIFGTDDLYPQLKPFYDAEVKRGNLEIADVIDDVNGGYNDIDFDLAIISSHHNFYSRLKQVEDNGIPRNKIIDGRVFKVPNLNFSRLLTESIAYGVIEKTSVGIVEKNSVVLMSTTIYPRLSVAGAGVELGTKSYIVEATIERDGVV